MLTSGTPQAFNHLDVQKRVSRQMTMFQAPYFQLLEGKITSTQIKLESNTIHKQTFEQDL